MSDRSTWTQVPHEPLPERRLQRCVVCDDPTGRSDATSLYVGEEGPLCPDCHEELEGDDEQ